MKKTAVALLLAFVAAALFSTACSEARTFARAPEYKGKPVSLDLSDIDLWNALSLFAEEYGLNVVLEPGIVARVTLRVANVPWDRAFDMILKKHGLVMKVDSPVIRIGKAPEKKTRRGGAAGPRPVKLTAADSKGSDAGYWYSGKPVSLDLHDAEAGAAVRLLAEAGGAKIDVDPDVTGKVTLLVENVPWDHILDIIVDMNGLAKVSEGDAIRIARTAKTETAPNPVPEQASNPAPNPETMRQPEAPAGPGPQESEFDRLAARKAPPGVLIEELIKMFGKEQITNVIRKQRQNRITVLVGNTLREVFGPPDEKYVSARTIQEDLRKMNLSVQDFRKLLEASHPRS